MDTDMQDWGMDVSILFHYGPGGFTVLLWLSLSSLLSCCCCQYCCIVLYCASAYSSDEVEMSEEHRRYLAMKQFDGNLVTDVTLLENLYAMQALRDQEFLQIRSQLSMDQRRERLFDTLKRKPDHFFPTIKAAFEDQPYGTIPTMPSRNLLANQYFEFIYI